MVAFASKPIDAEFDPRGNTFFSSFFSYLVNDMDRGDVEWLNKSDAFAQRLAYVNGRNQAVMRVDNTTNVPWNDKRNSVRIESSHWYGVGSLWVVDIAHVPYGCSVSLLYSVRGSPLVSCCDRFRFGPRSGRMVSLYETRVTSETSPLVFSPAA